MVQHRETTPEQIEEMRRQIRAAKLQLQEAKGSKRRALRALKQKKTIFKVVGWIAFLALLFLLVTVIVSVNLTKLRGGIPHIAGYHLFVVQSGSMEPTLKTGTVIISKKPSDPGALEVNSIVTFRTLSGAIVTHRIIETVPAADGGKGYRTKGDNPRNSVDPEILTPDRVIGIFVARVPMT